MKSSITLLWLHWDQQCQRMCSVWSAAAIVHALCFCTAVSELDEANHLLG
jgi:hypothetical protein